LEFHFGFCEAHWQEVLMARLVRCGLIQTHCEWSPEKYSIKDISKKMLDKTEKLIEAAAKKKTHILCLQELFNGPYFCAEQQIRWHELTEQIPDGPTTERMKKLAKKHGMVMVVPIYEREMTGVFFNTAAVIDADGKYLGKYRKHHIPQVAPGFWEKFYFTPGNTGYVVFETKFARLGVYICYDRHFPEGARILGLGGAEIVFNPSATVAGLSEYLWELEQPAHAAANGYFVGAINRVGKEAPWNIGEFYGKSYFCNPRGKIIAQASRDKDELLTHDIDLDEIAQVRATWQFFRDRRPESYGEISRTQAQTRADAAN
jgi:N-carbamoylputrescine amidase